MSASREKKQRQGGLDEALTQKQTKERQEEAARKRRVVGYWITGVVVVVLAAALLIWNNTRGSVAAATVNGQKYTVAEVSYYYQQAASTWSQFGIRPSDIMEEETGRTYGDYFKEQALDSLVSVTALVDAAKAEGYTLSAAGQAQLDSTYETIDTICSLNGINRKSFLTQSYGKYMSEGTFNRLLERAVLADDYAAAHQAGYTYDGAALQAYYDEHADEVDFYRFRTFYISGVPESKQDADGNTIEATEAETQAAMDQARTQAGEAVAEIEAAGSASRSRETAFIAVAPSYVAESSRASYESDPDYSLSEDVQGSTLSSASYAGWLMESGRRSGDVTSVETSSGVYVVLFLDRERPDEATVDIRHILIKAELTQTDDPLTADVDESAVPTQEALDAAKAECERLLAEWESGPRTAESFGALAAANSADPGSSANGGAYTSVREGTMFGAFNDWIFDSARQPGDVTLIENPQSGQQGWHIVYFEGDGGPYWQSVADSALRSADQTAWREELESGYEAVAASGMSSVG